MLSSSILWRALSAVSAWVDRQWERSLLRRAVIGPERLPRRGPGVTETAAGKLRELYVRLFKMLRLDRLTEDSVFLRTDLFLLLTVFFAPLLPTMAVLALALATVFSLFLRIGRGEMRVRPSPLNKWIYLFVALTLASTAMSLTLRESLAGGVLTSFFALFSVAVVTVCGKDRAKLELLIRAVVISGFAVAAVGVMQYALGGTSRASWLDSEIYTDISLRVVSTLENPNVLSEFLLLATPLAVASVINAKSFNGRLWAGLAAAVMCACLVFTWSRGGWLGLALGVVVFLAALDTRFVVLGVLGIAAFVVVMPGAMLNRLSNLGDRADASTNYRYYIYLSAFDMIKNYWMSGVGTGVSAYKAAYARYEYAAVIAPHAHNLFLQILCESGFVTFFALLASLFTAFRSAASVAARTRDRELKVWGAALMAGGTGYMLQSMTEYSFYNYRVTLVFWVIVGIAVCLRLVEEGERPAL